jgi:hypothetical protein
MDYAVKFGVKMTEETVFARITAPLQTLLKKEADQLHGDSLLYKLSLYFFTMNLVYAIINKIASISLLVTDIKTSPDAQKLGLVDASKSMYSEAFGRYDPKLFRRIFLALLEQLDFSDIPEIKSLGRFILVDGSIFPALRTMAWAAYTSTGNALKMHLAFELNRMIPVQFISTDANSNEKAALLAMLGAGVTYIADRGYVSFEVFRQIASLQAFFIIRIKANLKVSVSKQLDVVVPASWLAFFSDVSDSLICFSNDKHQATYRLVSFVAYDEAYRIATNRLDLTTGEIIMLYAYRWQIELFFRFIKRTFNALHLWSQSERGVEIQFYLYLIVYLLLIHFKQGLKQEQEAIEPANKAARPCQEKHLSRTPGRGIVTLLGEKLSQLWKMSIHWIRGIQNLLFKPLNPDVAAVINAIQ